MGFTRRVWYLVRFISITCQRLVRAVCCMDHSAEVGRTRFWEFFYSHFYALRFQMVTKLVF